MLAPPREIYGTVLCLLSFYYASFCREPKFLESTGQMVVQMRVPKISLENGLQAQNECDLCRYGKYKR